MGLSNSEFMPYHTRIVASLLMINYGEPTPGYWKPNQIYIHPENNHLYLSNGIIMALANVEMHADHEGAVAFAVDDLKKLSNRYEEEYPTHTDENRQFLNFMTSLYPDRE